MLDRWCVNEFQTLVWCGSKTISNTPMKTIVLNSVGLKGDSSNFSQSYSLGCVLEITKQISVKRKD